MSTASEPTRSIEVERAYDVDDDTALPDWERLPAIARVDAPEHRALDARYFDTADLALARARVAVRRRTGGSDAGWHVKSSAPEGRHEWGWPLGADDDMPQAIIDAVARWASPPFAQIARIRNDRTAYALRDADGGLVAEMVDDRVSAVAGTGRETLWREWEVELGPAASADADWRAAFFTAVDALVEAAGGRIASSASKLGRALGA
ncbi:CYTH domain-containing protein [Microbacterium sp. 18062]|uniref:CYTH domain-containing protein n=1 Tax=Microbacterium sp. 18062 TaxID=2681410 RepID=UPI00135A1E53|nr:CYTH domain-containing protein [Microbacterium sp. 18062]